MTGLASDAPAVTVLPGLPDAEGHLADALRDACLHHLRLVVSFNTSRVMAEQVLDHLASLLQREQLP